MVRTNRRQFGSLALLGAGHLLLCGRSALGYPAPQQKKLNSTLAGVLVGCHSYSFRDRDLEEALMMMAEVGFGAVELWQDHMEFTHGGREGEAREQLRQWRLSVPLSEFEVAAALASERRTEFYAYNFAFWDDVTDAEIDRVFEMTKALGAKVVTGAANPAMVPR
ncbi:MAG: hypothetical protein ACE5JX_21230, partial [Acidobacteriota bacterium]